MNDHLMQKGDRYLLTSWNWKRVFKLASFGRQIGDKALSPIKRRWYGKFYVWMEAGTGEPL